MEKNIEGIEDKFEELKKLQFWESEAKKRIWDKFQRKTKWEPILRAPFLDIFLEKYSFNFFSLEDLSNLAVSVELVSPDDINPSKCTAEEIEKKWLID